MNKSNYISALILLAAASTAYAQTIPPAVPGDQGLASVNRNVAKNPENKGLQNASEQLQQNQVKHTEQAQKRVEKREQQAVNKAERIETRAEHRETMGRPAKVDRPGK